MNGLRNPGSRVLSLVKTSMDKCEASKSLDDLCEAIQQIYRNDASRLSFEELYRKAYMLTIDRYGGLLYEGVSSCQDAYVRSIAQQIAEELTDSLLTTLCLKWDEFKRATKMVCDILMYVDGNFCKKERKPIVEVMSLNLFHQHVLKQKSIKSRFIDIVMFNIRGERNGNIIADTITMRKALKILQNVSSDRKTKLYTTYFEQTFLAETAKYYQAESRRTLDDCTVPEFLEKAENRMYEEQERVDSYLFGETMVPLMKTVTQAWISDHYQSIVNSPTSGCPVLFKEDKVSHLHRMYSLFLRSPDALEQLRTAFEQYLKQCGEDILRDPELTKDAIIFVEALFTLKRRADHIVIVGFEENKTFLAALKSAFEHLVNSSPILPNYAALYMDDLFKRRLRVLSGPVEFEEIMDNIKALFRYIHDKDLFEAYCRFCLGKRLLTGRCDSPEEERVFISHLKSECGHTYTSKMEGMFNDIKISEDLTREFRSFRNDPTDRSALGTNNSAASTLLPRRVIDLNVKILMSNNWTTEREDSISLPPALAIEKAAFETYYFSRHDGRCLTWLYSHGGGVLQANYPKGSHEITCTVYQMCILMLFNDNRTLTLAQLKEFLGVCHIDLKRHFLSLSVSKLKLLHKVPNSGHLQLKEVGENDEFAVNSQFESRAKRFRVPLIVAGCKGMKADGVSSSSLQTVAVHGSIQVPFAVEETRKHAVEAAIVRIMKSRKQMTHNDLVSQVLSHLHHRFRPNIQLIKQRIETLIYREYLERSKTDRRTYCYIA